MKKILATIFLMSGIWSSANAALVVYGDTTARTSNTIVGEICQYPRYLGALTGSGTVTMDSLHISLKNRAGAPDTVIVAVFTDSAGVKPKTRLWQDTVIIASTSQTDTSIILGSGAYTLTAGVAHWIAIGMLSDTASSQGVDIGTTANTVTGGGYLCSGSAMAYTPWGAYTAGTASAYSASFWGHDGSSDPSGEGVTQVFIRGGVTLRGGVTVK